MAYDATKDKEIVKLPTIQLNEDTKLEIGVYQYDGNAKKIRMRRTTKRASGKEWSDNTSITKDEFMALINNSDKLLGGLL